MVATVLVTGLVLAAGAWLLLAREGSPLRPPSDEELTAELANRFLRAWTAEDWSGMQALIADQSLDAATIHAEADATAGITATAFTPGQPVVDGDSATVPVDATWDVEGFGTYTYTTELPLTRMQATPSPGAGTGTGATAGPTPTPSATTAPGWQVDWWYTVVHPDLGPDRRIQRVRTFQERAPILAADGSVLVGTGEVVSIGVEPRRVTDPAAVIAALDAATDADAGDLGAFFDRDDLVGEQFYALTDLPRERFDQVRDQLAPVPGVLFREVQARVPAAPGLAQRLLGSTGEITADGLEELGAPYAAGDLVGRSGLERAFEQHLAGDPERELRIVDDLGLVRVLAFEGGAAPEPVRTSLDLAVQQAAQAALAGVTAPAAIVAVDTATGQVRAAASQAPDGIDRALAARYPPGSTFKIVTLAALLDAGRTPESIVDCPQRAQVGGFDFGNAGDQGFGPISLAEAFARSCNTAFGIEGAAVGGGTLADMASQFGFNVDYDPGVAAFGGSFPEPEDDAEVAAASFGQARVEVSPLHMASVAAAAASGTWRPPMLVLDDADAATPEGQALPAGVVGPLQTLMRQAVTSGTGGAADLPGQPVHGKTGTAEFGSGPVLGSHAWFAGYRGDLAFAVLVEGGGAGSAVAAPIAAAFLAGLPSPAASQ